MEPMSFFSFIELCGDRQKKKPWANSLERWHLGTGFCRCRVASCDLSRIRPAGIPHIITLSSSMTGLLNLLQDVQRILNTKNDLLGIKYKFRAIARLKNAIKQKIAYRYIQSRWWIGLSTSQNKLSLNNKQWNLS